MAAKKKNDGSGIQQAALGYIAERRGLNSFKNPVFIFNSDKGRHLRQRTHLLTDAFRSRRQRGKVA